MSQIEIKKTIQRLETFPFRIRQEYYDWCIPANIEAVTKYYQPDSNVTQGYLVTLFGDMPHIGFESIKTKVLDVDKNFSWARIMYFKDSDFNQSFDKFADFVQKCVDDSTPPMISVPAGGGSWHILTVVGYGDEHFLVYNPAPHIITSQVPISKGGIQTALGAAKNLQEAATDSLVLSRKSG